MRILGIDPALTKSGWAVIERVGNTNKYIASGIIKTDSKTPLPERLKVIYKAVANVISEYNPDSASIEETFVNKNPATSLKLGCARGAIMTCLAMHDLQVSEFTAKYIKKSLTGSGAADKNQMLKMITLLMPKAQVKYDDEADAIAIALAA
ncbi:MAG: crossover junction endodeoxyribonuclease RuvC [Rickettsiales bacterium]|jgi:crossover junction endodeoxyribonuclease RuvC|nr:crossover junction endodeoxyribonuclease RuvC [Rickettsiales bacterium]